MKVANPQSIVAMIYCLLLLAITAQGQYYPGGIGNANLVIWLNANKIASITKNGANQVSQWSDLSGNGYNFTQVTAGNMPVYGGAASPTGMPALSFTSTSSQYLSLASLPATSFASGVSAFAVTSYNASQTTQGWQRIFDFGNGTGNNNFMMGRFHSSANAYYEGWKGVAGDQTWTTTNPIVDGSENLYEAVQQSGTAGTLATVAHYLAGAAQTATGAAGSSETYVPANITRTSNYIGRSNWIVDNYFAGTMSEILIYNTAFNTTERVILENYAAAEWNQTVSVSKYTPPSTTTYTTNLVGIGYTSAADNFLANPAGSTDGLGFSSTTTATGFLNTAGYLMAAHNGQSNTILTNTAISGIATSVDLWNRSWYLNATGGNAAGNVTLNFNFASYNGSALPGVSNYFLVCNTTDGSFATGTNNLIAVNTSTAGSTVSFVVTASSLAKGYYTIMWLPTIAQVSPAIATLCAGNNTSFSISAINGCSYQWQVNTGSGFSNVPATDPGGAIYSGVNSTTLTITGVTSSMNGYTYQVLVTPANDTYTEGPASVAVNTPAAQPLLASANPICTASPTTLSISTPAAGVTYNIYSDAALTTLVGSLTSAANTLVVSPAATTTYYEQAVETATGCVQTAAIQNVSVTVNPTPAAQSLLASANPICTASPTTLSISTPAAGVTYNIYSDAALTTLVGSLTSAANTLVVSPAATTTYYEQAVETATGCVETAAIQNVSVTVNPTPAAQSLLASANPICAASPTTLSISTPAAGVTYNIYSDAALTTLVGSLTSAANTLVVSPAVTTTYYEQAVETATGCVQTAPVQSIPVIVSVKPTITTTANLLLCQGQSDTLSASAPGAQITWLGYSTGDTLIVNPANTTTYTVVAEDATNCTDTAIVTIQVTSFDLSLTASPNPIVAGFPVSLTTISSVPYQVSAWNPEDQFPDQTALSQVFTITDTSQTFSVIAQSDNGCVDTASVTVVVQTNTGDFFIPNAFTPNGDGRDDVFKVYGSSIREINLRIFNQWGQLIFESQDVNRGWDGTYGGHLQPAGVYLYAVRAVLFGQPAAIVRKGSLSLIR